MAAYANSMREPADLPATLSLLEGNGEHGYDVGNCRGFPSCFFGRVPDSWQGPTRSQPTPRRPFVLRFLRPY
jgi:hypothetical protein